MLHHGAGDATAGTPCGREHTVRTAFELRDELGVDPCPVLAGLIAHSLEQVGPFNTFGESGDVACAWDPRRPALAAVDDQYVEVEAGEIDGRGQPGGPAAYD